MAQGPQAASKSKTPSEHTLKSPHSHEQHLADQSLLFINHYSVDGAGKSDGPDRKTIGAHVQRTIRFKKRVAAEVKLKSRVPDGILFPSRFKDITEEKVLTSSFQSACKLNETELDLLDRVTLEEKLEKASLLLETVQLRLLKFPQPSLFTGLFDSVLPEAFSKCKPAKIVFHFFLQTFIPRIFPVSSQADEHTHWVIQSALASSEVLFAILTISAASFLALGGGTRPSSIGVADVNDHHGTISAHDAVTFKIIAVKLLRSAVEGDAVPKLEFLLYSVICLMTAEIVAGDTAAIRVHANALRRLVELRAGYENMPAHFTETLLSSCYIASTITGDPPISPPLHQATTAELEEFSTLAPIFDTHPRLRQLGQAFFDAQINAVLGPRLVSIFRDIRIFTLWREYHHLECTRPSIAHMKYCQTLYWRCHYQALALPFEPHHEATPMQEPCRIALLIFWNANNLVNRPGSLLYSNLAARLESALERPVLHFLREHTPGMLMWILLLGAFITAGQSESQWFLGNLAACLQGAERTDWVSGEAVIRRFLYTERIYRETFERIWNDVIALLMPPVYGGASDITQSF